MPVDPAAELARVNKQMAGVAGDNQKLRAENERLRTALEVATESERTACAQAICTKCRDEGPAVWHEKSGRFAHDVFVCRADAIWKRGRE